MSLNELCTNAVKYGALSKAGGRVKISSTIDAAGTVFALRWIETGGPRLLDVRMPGLSGPEVAARIRTQPGPNSNIPILAFTADVDLIDLTAPGSDFDGVISKPISPTDLITTLAAHLKWDAPMNEVADVVAL